MEQCPENCEAAAIASKEYFDKSRAVIDGYGKALRGDSWWLANVMAGVSVSALVLINKFIGRVARLWPIDNEVLTLESLYAHSFTFICYWC